jgi:hypothetical protein
MSTNAKLFFNKATVFAKVAFEIIELMKKVIFLQKVAILYLFFITGPI